MFGVRVIGGTVQKNVERRHETGAGIWGINSRHLESRSGGRHAMFRNTGNSGRRMSRRAAEVAANA
jgi:hypothetical protein